MLKRSNGIARQLVALALLCGFFPILSSAPQALAVGATPTIAITSVTGAVPYTGTANLGSGLPKLATQIGKTITFNVTLSNLTPGQAPTGQVRITGDDDTKAFYCTTSTFNFSGTEATASCAWKVRSIDAQKFFALYLTDPTKYTTNVNDSTDYLNATSATGREIYVAGIVYVYGLSDALVIGNDYTITAETHQDFLGDITFTLNGSPISGCENRTSSNSLITCAFRVPAAASTLTFAFDYTPATSYVTAGLSTQFASFPIFHTVGSYYHPNSTSWSAETAYNANYNEATLDSTFYEKDGLYYKLNAANGQAMVMAYKRSVLTNTVNIPATFTATGFSSSNTALNRTNPIFNRTYTVTQIGKSAFQLDASNVPATLISTLTIPNTVTAIKDAAFYRQCNIASIVIPDSVRVIGGDSFSNMEAGNTINECVGKSGVDSLIVGAGIESLGENSLKGTTPSTLQFNGSPDSMFFNLKPSNFDAFQFNDAFGQAGNLGMQINSCSRVISYSGIVTGNFVGSQLKAWQHWATANNCIPNTNLRPAAIFLKPSPIAQPTVDSATVTSLRVIWTAPLSDGDSTITGYSLQYSSNSGSTWTQSSCSSCQLGASPYVVTGLNSATVYIFRVNATNDIGTSDWSTPSSPVSTLAFSLPPDFTISPSSETATVGIAITGYVITNTVASDSFAISPSAPAGLSFNLSTGALTGTPTETSTATVYTITGTNPRGTDTATFTLGVNLRTISIAAVPITAPVSGATPLASISSNGQYTTAITWNGSPSTFAASTIYTAIATVTPVTNYTLTGVTANFFTVTGATSVSNSANAGVITAVFPATSAPTPPPVTPAVAEVYKYPEQTSSITSITQGCPTDVNTVVIKGSFLAPIANIFINNQAISSSLWKQTATQIVITINAAGAKSLSIQIFNGQVPILATQNVEIATSCPVTPPTPTPTPTTKPTPTPTPTPPNNPQPTAQMVKVGTVYMATGLYQLSPVAKKQLAAFAKTINSSAAKTILVYGHTDIRGGVNNTLLSQNRAKAVAAYLRPLLKLKKISIGWYASRKPASTGTTAADLAQNRRVEIYTK